MIERKNFMRKLRLGYEEIIIVYTGGNKLFTIVKCFYYNYCSSLFLDIYFFKIIDFFIKPPSSYEEHREEDK